MTPSSRSICSQVSAALNEAGDRYSALKDLAKTDRPVLQHLATLKKMHQQNPQLGGKEASTLMQAIMQRLFAKDEQAALTMGRMTCEPDIVSWMGFFDGMAGAELGAYLGISSASDIPAANAALAGDEELPAEDDAPPIDPEADADVPPVDDSPDADIPPPPRSTPAAESGLPSYLLRRVQRSGAKKK